MKKLPNSTIIGVIAVAAVMAISLVLIKGKTTVNITGKPAGQTISPDILFLTQPVTTLSGAKIDKIVGNTLYVSHEYSIQTMGAAPIGTAGSNSAPAVLPTPVTKTVTYKVTLGKNTQINRQESMVPYLFKSVAPSPAAQLGAKDLKVGDVLSNIFTGTDLRTLTTGEFEATSIQLNPISNYIFGKVEKVADNTITMKAVPPQPMTSVSAEKQTVPAEKTYTVLVTSDTEISRYAVLKLAEESKPGEISGPQTPSKEKLAINDIKAGQQINVYTNVDVVTNQKFTALRIDPVEMTSPAVGGNIPGANTLPVNISGQPVQPPPGTGVNTLPPPGMSGTSGVTGATSPATSNVSPPPVKSNTAPPKNL